MDSANAMTIATFTQWISEIDIIFTQQKASLDEYIVMFSQRTGKRLKQTYGESATRPVLLSW